MSFHPNIARAVAVEDRGDQMLAVVYELADEGDFGSYAWGREVVTMATLLR